MAANSQSVIIQDRRSSTVNLSSGARACLSKRSSTT